MERTIPSILITIILSPLLINPITADIPHNVNLALTKLRSDPNTPETTRDMVNTIVNDAKSIANQETMPIPFNQKHFLDQARHLLGVIIGGLANNTDAAESLLKAGSPIAKTFIDLLRGEHVGTRLWIEASEISTVYKDLTEQYQKLQNIPYNELSSKEYLQKRLTDCEGMRKLVAVFQLALPIAGRVAFDAVKDQIQTWIAGLVSTSSFVTTAVDAASDYTEKKLGTHAQTAVEFCVNSAFEFANIKYGSKEMINTMNYVNTACASQFQSLREGIGTAANLIWNRDKFASTKSYLGSWLSNPYGSWNANPQIQIDDGMIQDKKDQIDHETSDEDSIDFMLAVSQKPSEEHIKRLEKLGHLSSTGTRRQVIKVFDQSGKAAAAARRLLNDVSGFEIYKTLMNLTIVIVSFLSVMVV